MATQNVMTKKNNYNINEKDCDEKKANLRDWIKKNIIIVGGICVLIGIGTYFIINHITNAKVELTSLSNDDLSLLREKVHNLYLSSSANSTDREKYYKLFHTIDRILYSRCDRSTSYDPPKYTGHGPYLFCDD